MASFEPLAVDYFSAGVPTAALLLGNLEDIQKISVDNVPNHTGTAQGICLIGAMSFFEAFCKDHFASLINIEPTLIEKLKNSGQDVMIDAVAVALLGTDIRHKLGFCVAEKYDFGTAKKVNALYSSLLNLTPFSKDEERIYSGLLRDRNLLVHHGGVYTMNYLANHPKFKDTRSQNAFWNSRVFTQDEVTKAVGFLRELAKKMSLSAHAALSRYVSDFGEVYEGERKQALNFLLWFGDDEIDSAQSEE